MHPRPDQRHIRVDDVARIAAVLHHDIEYNIEGNPFAPARGTYPGLVELAQSVRPAQVMTTVVSAEGTSSSKR